MKVRDFKKYYQLSIPDMVSQNGMHIKPAAYIFLCFQIVYSIVNMDCGVIGYRVFWSGSGTDSGSWICNVTDCSQNHCVSTYSHLCIHELYLVFKYTAS